jgi:hypothetical protein
VVVLRLRQTALMTRALFIVMITAFVVIKQPARRVFAQKTVLVLEDGLSVM